MDQLLYLAGRALLGFIRLFPLAWVARAGRAVGGLVFRLDARHRRVTIQNLARCLGGERTPAEIAALAQENFRRIGEGFACAIKTAGLSEERMRGLLDLTGLEQAGLATPQAQAVRRVFALGHFGNFEVFGHAVQRIPWCVGATTYRALNRPGLNRLLVALRGQRRLLFFERRRDGAALRAALRDQPLLLGLFCDQHAGDNGLRLPFFGQDCSTSKAPAVYALRFHAPLHLAICYRTGLARWRIEVSPEIPTYEPDGTPRSLADIMTDVNRGFEAAIRRDPANWFWVHKRWKPPSPRALARAAAAAAAAANPANPAAQPAEDDDEGA